MGTIIGPIKVRPMPIMMVLGINFGTSPIECATSNDSGCFWAETNYTHSTNQPGGAMITSSDPYKSGDMTLSVNYNSDTNRYL